MVLFSFDNHEGACSTLGAHSSQQTAIKGSMEHSLRTIDLEKEERRHGFVVEALDWESGNLGKIPGSATNFLEDLSKSLNLSLPQFSVCKLCFLSSIFSLFSMQIVNSSQSYSAYLVPSTLG